MTDDLIAWIREQLDDDEAYARNAFGDHNQAEPEWTEIWSGAVQVGPNEDLVLTNDSQVSRHMVRHDPAHELNVVAAHRAILAEHLPQWQTVEWDHDQNGKGEALCCPRCQNAEHSEWNPPVGRARGLPEGFVTPYVLAPCHTLRLLALVYDQRPGYQEEWRP